LDKDLANLWSRKKITKKAHAGRGLEIIWEMSVPLIRRVEFHNALTSDLGLAELAPPGAFYGKAFQLGAVEYA
jgi:hypothetical protein